jgi:hypothetical protein
MVVGVDREEWERRRKNSGFVLVSNIYIFVRKVYYFALLLTQKFSSYSLVG